MRWSARRPVCVPNPERERTSSAVSPEKSGAERGRARRQGETPRRRTAEESRVATESGMPDYGVEANGAARASREKWRARDIKEVRASRSCGTKIHRPAVGTASSGVWRRANAACLTG